MDRLSAEQNFWTMQLTEMTQGNYCIHVSKGSAENKENKGDNNKYCNKTGCQFSTNF